MIQFDFPWAFLCLPLPVLAHYCLVPLRSEVRAIRSPFLGRFIGDHDYLLSQSPSAVIRRIWQKVVVTIIWLGIVCAAAQPVSLLPEVEIKQAARNLMVVVDLSASMAEKDVELANGDSLVRIDAAKQLLAAFVAERAGDNLALAVFADAPYMIQPFSEDRDLFLTLLAEVQVPMAGAKTMLGDAIAFAYQHFLNQIAQKKSSDLAKEHTLILITDGNDSGSLIPPIRAAELASSIGLRIYPVLVGDAEALGDVAVNKAALMELAAITGGEFFSFTDDKGIVRISAALDEIAPSGFQVQYFKPSRALYYWPMAIAIIIAIFAHTTAALANLFSKASLTKGENHVV